MDTEETIVAVVAVALVGAGAFLYLKGRAGGLPTDGALPMNPQPLVPSHGNVDPAFDTYLRGVSAVPIVGRPAAAIFRSAATGAIHDVAVAVNHEDIPAQYNRLTKQIRVRMSRAQAIASIAKSKGMTVAQVTALVPAS